MASDRDRDPINEARELELRVVQWRRFRAIRNSAGFLMLLGAVIMIAGIAFGRAFLIILAGACLGMAVFEAIRRRRTKHNQST